MISVRLCVQNALYGNTAISLIISVYLLKKTPKFTLKIQQDAVLGS